MSLPPKRLSGQETLKAFELNLDDATVLDFWQWAFSDLRANNIRGIFAEWLVSKILKISPSCRDSWASWDLETAEGVRIEVKTSAYLQAWTQKRPSSIVFGGLRSRTWDPLAGYAKTPSYNADLYVFCIHIEADPDRYAPMDLSQWRFYLLDREVLVNQNLKTISIKTLARLAKEMTAAELGKIGMTKIKEIIDTRPVSS
jgi:hypothetical protein